MIFKKPFMHTTNTIGTIILGAGASSRMGRPKQLLEWRNELLVNRAIRQATALSAGPVVLVLGANAEVIAGKVTDPFIITAVNDNWAEGMGGSIVTGLKALQKHRSNLEGVLITLVDQPLITTTHLSEIIEKFKKNNTPLVAAAYGNTLGVPALFSADLFPRLLTLSGKEGAKKIIHQVRDKLTKWPLPVAKIDLDTPEEWKAFLAKEN